MSTRNQVLATPEHGLRFNLPFCPLCGSARSGPKLQQPAQKLQHPAFQWRGTGRRAWLHPPVRIRKSDLPCTACEMPPAETCLPRVSTPPASRACASPKSAAGVRGRLVGRSPLREREREKSCSGIGPAACAVSACTKNLADCSSAAGCLVHVAAGSKLTSHSKPAGKQLLLPFSITSWFLLVTISAKTRGVESLTIV